MLNRKDRIRIALIIASTVIVFAAAVCISKQMSEKVQDSSVQTEQSAETDYESRKDKEACSFDEACSDGRPEDFSVSSLLEENDEKITLHKSLDMFDTEGNVVLFYSFDDCPWCYDALPVFRSVAALYDDAKWYYVALERDEREEGNEDYDTLVDFLGIDGKIYIPCAVWIHDGTVTGYHIGTVESHVKDENGELPVISDNQIFELEQIYSDQFEKMNEQ